MAHTMAKNDKIILSLQHWGLCLPHKHIITVHLWNRLSTSILKYFKQNLKNSLVAERIGPSMTRPWVAQWIQRLHLENGRKKTIFCNAQYQLVNKAITTALYFECREPWDMFSLTSIYRNAFFVAAVVGGVRYIRAYDFVYVFLDSFTLDFNFTAQNFHSIKRLTFARISHTLYYGNILMILKAIFIILK